MRVLLTRPPEPSRALAGTLGAEGIEALVWPLTRIRPTAEALEVPAGTGGLLFTSASAVRVFAGLSRRRDLPALCVGETTARAAREAGFQTVRPAAGDAGALARLAAESGIRAFLHPRGRHAAGDLAGWLAARGHEVREAVIYEAEETGPPPAPVATALSAGAVDLVTVWSPRGGEILARQLPAIGAALGEAALLAISAAAARPLAGAGFRETRVAAAPSGAAMLAAIRATARPK